MMFWLYNETKLISKYAKFAPLRLQIKLLDNEYFLELQKTINKVMVRNGFAKKRRGKSFSLEYICFRSKQKTLE